MELGALQLTCLERWRTSESDHYPSIQSPHFCTSPLAPQGMIGTDEVEFFGEPSMILSE
jgi:hypothetical protein